VAAQSPKIYATCLKVLHPGFYRGNILHCVRRFSEVSLWIGLASALLARRVPSPSRGLIGSESDAGAADNEGFLEHTVGDDGRNVCSGPQK
jgi:hypothetical protein